MRTQVHRRDRNKHTKILIQRCLLATRHCDRSPTWISQLASKPVFRASLNQYPGLFMLRMMSGGGSSPSTVGSSSRMSVPRVDRAANFPHAHPTTVPDCTSPCSCANKPISWSEGPPTEDAFFSIGHFSFSMCCWRDIRPTLELETGELLISPR